MGVLFYFYAAPFECDTEDVATPPWLYGTLFSLTLLELIVLIDDAVIMSLSCRGRIDHSTPPDLERMFAIRNGLVRDTGKSGWPDPDRGSPRAKLKRYIYIRNVLFILEVIHSAFYGYACWSPAVTDQLSKCEAYSGPLAFARAVVVAWWIVIIIYAVGWLIYVDPIGLCTPGLLDELEILDKLDHIGDPTEVDLFKFHRASLETSHIRRRLQTICCCLGLRGHQSRGMALQDAAGAFHTIFNDVDLVGSDIVAGLILLNLDQKQKVRSGHCLVEEHKQVHSVDKHGSMKYQMYSDNV